jgi:hypothetical protein
MSNDNKVYGNYKPVKIDGLLVPELHTAITSILISNQRNVTKNSNSPAKNSKHGSRSFQPLSKTIASVTSNDTSKSSSIQDIINSIRAQQTRMKVFFK